MLSSSRWSEQWWSFQPSFMKGISILPSIQGFTIWLLLVTVWWLVAGSLGSFILLAFLCRLKEILCCFGSSLVLCFSASWFIRAMWMDIAEPIILSYSPFSPISLLIFLTTSRTWEKVGMWTFLSKTIGYRVWTKESTNKLRSRKVKFVHKSQISRFWHLLPHWYVSQWVDIILVHMTGLKYKYCNNNQ